METYFMKWHEILLLYKSCSCGQLLVSFTLSRRNYNLQGKASNIFLYLLLPINTDTKVSLITQAPSFYLSLDPLITQAYLVSQKWGLGREYCVLSYKNDFLIFFNQAAQVIS